MSTLSQEEIEDISSITQKEFDEVFSMECIPPKRKHRNRELENENDVEKMNDIISNDFLEILTEWSEKVTLST